MISPERLKEARNSPTGQTLTASQFDEGSAIAGIIDREIHKSGSFRDKLTDFAHAYARSQKFDALRGELIVRDLYTVLYGQTMNETREALMEREAVLRDTGHEQALQYARSIGPRIAEGETMPFYRAYDETAVMMAKQHSITEAGAKELMKEAYRQAEGRELYDDCKELEERHHTPKREARTATNQKTRKQAAGRTPERTM